MTCKNICAFYRAKKSHQGSYYANGYKRCTNCEVFLKWDGLRCPCCRGRVRIKTHDAYTRRKFNSTVKFAA